jgi:hypothetical protein
VCLLQFAQKSSLICDLDLLYKAPLATGAAGDAGGAGVGAAHRHEEFGISGRPWLPLRIPQWLAGSEELHLPLIPTSMPAVSSSDLLEISNNSRSFLNS